MSDFHQNGVITDFHNLTRRPVEELERELCQFAKRRPMGLILPSLFSELETAKALRRPVQRPSVSLSDLEVLKGSTSCPSVLLRTNVAY